MCRFDSCHPYLITAQRLTSTSQVSQTRSVPRCGALAIHPGGNATFALDLEIGHRRVQPTELTQLNLKVAHEHFKRTLAGSIWSKLRGWHAFRHSFCSNCAAAGVDQRIISAWVGHQTDDMVRRYRHLIPNRQQQAIQQVFGSIVQYGVIHRLTMLGELDRDPQLV